MPSHTPAHRKRNRKNKKNRRRKMKLPSRFLPGQKRRNRR